MARDLSRPYAVFGVDIQRWSDRDLHGQVDLRRELHRILEYALEAADIDAAGWTRQDSGDGILALVPPAIPKASLVADLLRELKIELNRLNAPRSDKGRMRLRVVMHHGDVLVDGTGYAGTAIVIASRLLDSNPVRKALDQTPEAELAVILSDRMFEDVEGQRGLFRGDFQPVTVVDKQKRFEGRAWIHIPGTRPSDLPAASSEQSKARNKAAHRQTFRNSTIGGHAIQGDGNITAGGDINPDVRQR